MVRIQDLDDATFEAQIADLIAADEARDAARAVTTAESPTISTEPDTLSLADHEAIVAREYAAAFAEGKAAGIAEGRARAHKLLSTLTTAQAVAASRIYLTTPGMSFEGAAAMVKAAAPEQHVPAVAERWAALGVDGLCIPIARDTDPWAKFRRGNNQQ